MTVCSKVLPDSRDLPVVSINKDGNHWFLLRVRPTKKLIELWDSLGHKPANRHYLESIMRYLYDIDSLRAEGGNLWSREWAQDWQCIDRSWDSLR